MLFHLDFFLLLFFYFFSISYYWCLAFFSLFAFKLVSSIFSFWKSNIYSFVICFCCSPYLSFSFFFSILFSISPFNFLCFITDIFLLSKGFSLFLSEGNQHILFIYSLCLSSSPSYLLSESLCFHPFSCMSSSMSTVNSCNFACIQKKNLDYVLRFHSLSNNLFQFDTSWRKTKLSGRRRKNYSKLFSND